MSLVPSSTPTHAFAGLDCETYGSDKAGLVCAYRFAAGRPGVPIGADDAIAWLEARRDSLPAPHGVVTNPHDRGPHGSPGPGSHGHAHAAHVPAAAVAMSHASTIASADVDAQDNGEFIWLHFNLANTAAQRFLRLHLALPEDFHGSLATSLSTRVERSGQWLLATINDVQFFTADASAASSVNLCVEPRLLVSARTTPLRSLDRLRASVRAGETFRSPAELLAHLLRDQADVLTQIVRDATAQVDAIEDKLIAGHIPSNRTRLGQIRRVLVRLQRLLAPEPQALFRLLNRAPAWIGLDDVHEMREAAEELAHAVAGSAALVERVRLLQEELFALVNEQINRTLFVLTVVTVTAMPLTIIPGLFGMNVGGVPLRDQDSGFWIMVVVLVLLTTCGAVWAFRRRREF